MVRLRLDKAGLDWGGGMHSLMASIHLGSQSVIGAFVHEVRRVVCTEGNRSGSFRNVRRLGKMDDSTDSGDHNSLLCYNTRMTV